MLGVMIAYAQIPFSVSPNSLPYYNPLAVAAEYSLFSVQFLFSLIDSEFLPRDTVFECLP